MRKGLLFFLGIISFLGINSVNASEIYLSYEENIDQIQPYIDEIGYDKINNSINELINYYNINFSMDYPYYFISLSTRTYNSVETFHVVLTSFNNEYNENYFGRYFHQAGLTQYLLNHGVYSSFKQIVYDFDLNQIFEPDINFGFSYLSLFDIDSDYKRYNVYDYYYSNFDLYYRGDIIPTFEKPGTSGYLAYLKKDDILFVPHLSDSNVYISYEADSKFLVEPYYSYDNNISLEDNKLTTINLNDYSYVILSLKDYSIKDTFKTLAYIKGQLCPTTIYNYGTEEKKDYISGWQSPPCNNYFNDYTKFSLIIREEDISNHAIYYFTTYDKSKNNLIKVDSSVFNISYFTSENENNPNVLIDGKNYSVLPYSALTDTSVNTYVNGIDHTWTCAKYDTNCFLDSSGVNIDGLFNNPLETLKSIWGTIISIFELVTDFISLLPPVMQAFLYLAFGVGIALGIIKLIL